MISKILRKNIITSCLSNKRYFCKNKDYFQNKKLNQAQKTRMLFIHDESKLQPLNINLKALAPNFFTKHLIIKQSEKIIMPNKQVNAVNNSFISLQIPLSSDQSIKYALQRLKSNQVRIGRILQCMDSIAGLVGYRHCFGSLTNQNPFILVTGSVDSINLFQPIFIDKDIKMQGYVNSVGKTSMEIQINLVQQNKLKASALFVMISRNALDHTKSYPCPKLQISHLNQIQHHKAKQRMLQAQTNLLRRKKQMMQSYKLKPPSTQDIQVIHNIFLNSAVRAKQSIQTQKTVLTNIRLMHIQQRNIHNKIFGGFLMRQMVETGWIVASQFAGSQNLQIEDITNVYFREPVQIGCHLEVTGRVSYTRGNIMIVTMDATTYTLNPNPTRKFCCQMHMFLKCSNQQVKVFPRTYENGLYYVTSLNLFKHAFSNSDSTIN